MRYIHALKSTSQEHKQAITVWILKYASVNILYFEHHYMPRQIGSSCITAFIELRIHYHSASSNDDECLPDDIGLSEDCMVRVLSTMSNSCKDNDEGSDVAK